MNNAFVIKSLKRIGIVFILIALLSLVLLFLFWYSNHDFIIGTYPNPLLTIAFPQIMGWLRGILTLILTGLEFLGITQIIVILLEVEKNLKIPDRQNSP